ncbi:hypothetical protein ACHAQH_002831 [Verticillium albo-atrum]
MAHHYHATPRAFMDACAALGNSWRAVSSDPPSKKRKAESESPILAEIEAATNAKRRTIKSRPILVHYGFLRRQHDTFPASIEYCHGSFLNEVLLDHVEFIDIQIVKSCKDLLHDDKAPSAALRVVEQATWTLSVQWSLGTESGGFTTLTEENWHDVMGKLCEGTISGFIEARISEDDYCAFRKVMITETWCDRWVEDESQNEDAQSQTETGDVGIADGPRFSDMGEGEDGWDV